MLKTTCCCKCKRRFALYCVVGRSFPPSGAHIYAPDIIYTPIVRNHLTSKRRSVLYFPLFSRVKGRRGSTVLQRLIASIVGGSLLRRAHFESLRAAEAKNAATINHLMSKRQSVLYFPLYFPGSKVTRAHRSCHGSFRAS